MSTIYCTYLTTYFGNKLPMFYIGSTSVSKIKNGYRGSVSSKQYKTIWIKELKENSHLFKTKIISYHNDRISATIKENRLHKLLSVVSSPLYINQSNAIPDGIYGRSMNGKNNPMYGKKRKMSEETKKKISETKKGVKKSEETKQKMRRPKSRTENYFNNKNASGRKSKNYFDLSQSGTFIK